MNNLGTPTQLPVNVREALEAICAYGKGRCWYCDGKLPSARKAIRDGWDVQRIDGQPVASIILVCPPCLRERQEVGEKELLNRLFQPPPLRPVFKSKPERTLARVRLRPGPARA